MSKAKGWLPRRRCKCPRCSGLVSDARARKVARAVQAGRFGAELADYLGPDRTSANLAIKEQLEQPREQPLLDQLLGAAGLIRRNVTKEK